MKHNTAVHFERMLEDVAHSNGVHDTSKKFYIEPERQQGMIDLQAESSDLLGKINVIPVSAQKGEKIGFGVSSPIASRTNTNNNDRKTKDASGMSSDKYECIQTNSDVHMGYRKLDAWAHMGDFAERYAKHVISQVARDRLMTGFNGTHAADDTDRTAHPLLQDVNVGWLEKVRQKAPERMMGYDSDGAETEDTYNIGSGGTYANLDALVFDAQNSLQDAWHIDSGDQVVLLGRELWVYHGLKLYSNNDAATERNALNLLMASQSIAGLPVAMPPFFPKRGLIVTSYDNLSLYFQADAVRRAIIDNPKRDRVEEYLSSNDAYVVEDYGKFAGVRDGAIKLKNEAGEWY